MSLMVVAARPGCSVQGLDRFGGAPDGLAPGGATDRQALRLANRLVGNAEDALGIEVFLGGLELRAHRQTVIAVTGSPAPLWHNEQAAPFGTPLLLAGGDRLRVEPPVTGLRNFVAVRGGILDQPPGHDGSLTIGDELRTGQPVLGMPAAADVVAPTPHRADVTLSVVLGPRAHCFTAAALEALTGTRWRVSSDSDRVGVRLDGPALQRGHPSHLASEGVVRGSIQVPPSGQPVVLFADHPLTGGYPVIAVVIDRDVDLLSERRPGETVRFARRARGWR